MSSEQRYEIAVGRVRMAFVRRPIETAPADGMVGFIDFGTRERIERQAAGIFTGGEWRNSRNRRLAQQPTHWTECLGVNGGR